MHDLAPDTAPRTKSAPHPLITRLETEYLYPRLHSAHDIAEFTQRPGAHCLFVPGDAKRNLETLDAAVILPELVQAFQRAFDCAVVDDAIEARLREETRALKTPGFLFFREGRYLGAIEKVRDWTDYLARIQFLLGARP